MKRKMVIIAMLCAIFLILTGSGLPQQQTDSLAGLVPMTTSDIIKAKRLHIQIQGDPVEAVKVLMNEPWKNTDNEVKIEHADKDELNFTHIRMKQYYKGIPVDGTDIIVHVTGNNVIYFIDGDIAKGLNINTKPALSVSEIKDISVKDAVKYKCIDSDCRNQICVDSIWPPLDPNIVMSAENSAETYGTPYLFIRGFKRLCYHIFVKEKTLNSIDWEYIVDANNGVIYSKSYAINGFSSQPPASSGLDTTVKGIKLSWDKPQNGDSVALITGWKNSVIPKNYFLYYKGNASLKKAPWGVFDMHYHNNLSDTLKDSLDTLFRWAQRNTFDWGTNDRMAISVSKNIELTQKWMTDSLHRFGIDNNGKFLRANIHCSDVKNTLALFKGMDTMTYFGDGDTGTNACGNLDCIAHEICHGITFFTSILGVVDGNKNADVEERALNESFSDIMATAVEFSAQPDSSSIYPRRTPGCADWYIGEDVTIHYQAMRDFIYGFRRMNKDSISEGKATYFDGTWYWEDTAGNGVSWKAYQKLGVQNFAFYLLAKGNPDSVRNNDGHPVSIFSGIGISKATRVAMRANQWYLKQYSTYQDSKNAWLLAAQDYIDSGLIPSNSVSITDSAWKSVGVFPELRIRHVDVPLLEVGQKGNLKVSSSWGFTKNLPDTCFSIRQLRSNKGLTVDWSDTGLTTKNNKTMLCDTVIINQGTWLDNSNNLIGTLVIKSPDGEVKIALDSNGVIKLRDKARGFAF